MERAALSNVTPGASPGGSSPREPAPAKRRRAARTALAVGATTVALTAFVGFLHLPAARPLLAALGVKCPLGQATVESVDRGRRLAAAATRGDAPAPARPAFSFVLDATTLEETRAWTVRAGLDCVEDRPGLLRCRHVPASVLGVADAPPLDELGLGFNPQGRLVNVTTFRNHLDPTSASRAATLAAAALDARLGPAQGHEGSFAPDVLGRGTLASGSVRYRYRDYLAGVTAVNLGNANIAVREQYMSAAD